MPTINKKLKIIPQSLSTRGYALLEFVFYIVFFSILSLLVINTMITMTKSFRETSIHSELMEGGVIMERISREVRQAIDINTITATTLKLDTKDSGGADKIVDFVLSGTDLQYLEDAVLTGNLNTPNIEVTALSFTEVTTATGKGVKVSLTVRSTNDLLNRTSDFYSTTVLRGNY
jgi:Tfp pilus assembly protein PilE